MEKCDKCIWSTRSGGCVRWSCEFVDQHEAYEAWNRAMGITHERAVEYLQSTGWMQDHDREMTHKGYAKAKEDDEVSRRWEESYRASQMPWNHYTEMGG